LPRIPHVREVRICYTTRDDDGGHPDELGLLLDIVNRNANIESLVVENVTAELAEKLEYAIPAIRSVRELRLIFLDRGIANSTKERLVVALKRNRSLERVTFQATCENEEEVRLAAKLSFPLRESAIPVLELSRRKALVLHEIPEWAEQAGVLDYGLDVISSTFQRSPALLLDLINNSRSSNQE
jgi:hypothetical protein